MATGREKTGRFGRFRNAGKDYIWIILGSVITAAGINIFLVPFKIAPGGVSGIATVIYHLSGGRFPVGITMLVLNIPLFIFGYRYIGRRFIVRTLFGTVFLSAVIDASAPFTNIFVEKYISTVDGIQDSPDLLLYAIFGGVLTGAGLGLVFRSGATTGGTDLAARIVHHFLQHISMGKLLLIIDGAVVVFAMISFNSFLLGLYAIASLYVSSKLIDTILEGVNYAKAVYIISDKYKIIAERIMKEMDRGVTMLEGRGMYTNRERHVLFCVINRIQLTDLKKLVMEVDEKAFVILMDVREVVGEGFQNYNRQ